MANPLIGGRYESLGAIGQGGMATVFRALDTRLKRDVAVKVILGDPNEDSRLFYFHREARAIASLQHPNIVQIFDYSGPDEFPVYIVMQLVESGNLEQVLIGRNLPPELALLSAGQHIASALTHAHKKGVVHRDLKPSNVMVDDDCRLLLADFGLAKAYDDEARLGETVVGQRTTLRGTPGYVSPEQLRNKGYSPKSDIFSFGVLMYYLGCGLEPFRDSDPVAAMKKIEAGFFPQLDIVRPALSASYVEVVHRSLRQDPGARPTSKELLDFFNGRLADLSAPSAEVNLREYLGQQPTSTTGRVDPASDEVEGLAPRGDTAIITRPTERSYRARWTQEVADTTDPIDRTPPAERPKLEATHVTNVTETPIASTVISDRTRGRRRSRARVVLSAVTAAVILVGLGGVVVWKRSAPPPVSGVEEIEPAAIASDVAAAAPAPHTEVVRATGVPLPSPAPAAHSAAEEDTNNGVEPEITTPSPAQPEAKRAGNAVAPRAKRTARPPKRKRARADGTLHVVVVPWGKVFVDGNYEGNTPMVSKITLSAGRHWVEARHPDHPPQSMRVEVLPEQTAKVRFEFR